MKAGGTVIDKVKEIVENTYFRGVTAGTTNTPLGTLEFFNEVTVQICHLFPKSPDNPEGYEANEQAFAPETAPLTDNEIKEATGCPVVLSGHRRLVTKTASILKGKYQKKIEGIIEEIERYFRKLKGDIATGEDTFLVTSTLELRVWWKALKEKINETNR